MERPHDPDHALVVACQGNGQSCDGPFQALHDRHRDVVHRICLRITGDANDALDAAQDAFLLAFCGIRSFAFRSLFSSWLCRIAANASLERLRRHSPPSRFSELGGPDFECARATPHALVDRHERSIAIRDVLRRLSPHLREILYLRYFEGLSYDELATRLSIAPGSVRSRLHRAHEAFGARVRVLVDQGALEPLPE